MGAGDRLKVQNSGSETKQEASKRRLEMICFFTIETDKLAKKRNWKMGASVVFCAFQQERKRIKLRYRTGFQKQDIMQLGVRSTCIL